jgi:hypothetical protein
MTGLLDFGYILEHILRSYRNKSISSTPLRLLEYWLHHFSNANVTQNSTLFSC